MERGVAVEDGVRGAVAVFCLFDLRGADCGLCSVSGGEGLEPEALRFFAEAPFGERITEKHKFSHLNRRDGVTSNCVSGFPISLVGVTICRPKAL